MQRTIKFRATTWHSTLGSFGSGDIGRNIDPPLAAHLVEHGIADYVDVEPAQNAVQTSGPAVKTTRARRAQRASGQGNTPTESAALITDDEASDEAAQDEQALDAALPDAGQTDDASQVDDGGSK